MTQLRRWLARFVDRVEPDMADKRHRDATRERCVFVQTGEDGMSWLSALLPSVEAAAIDAKLEKAARATDSADQNGDVRTHEQKRADAFSDTLLGTDMTATGKSRIDIGVIVPIQSLVGLSDAPGETIDRSASIPATYIRSLAARQGTLFWRLLTDDRGDLLDVAKLGRYATGDLGMAIRFRDGTSVFPTSIVPATDCDHDHTDAYPAPTTASNLGALHRRAHRLKTIGHLTVRQPEPGAFCWDTSTGHTYTPTRPTTRREMGPPPLVPRRIHRRNRSRAHISMRSSRWTSSRSYSAPNSAASSRVPRPINLGTSALS